MIDKHVQDKDCKQLEALIIIYKFRICRAVANLRGHGRKRTVNGNSKRQITEMRDKETRTTSKDNTTKILVQGTSVSNHTISHCLRQHGLNRRGLIRTPLIEANRKKRKECI